MWTERLRKLVDPALICYFNRMRNVYCVDRCTNPDASGGLHRCDLACLKSNVLVLSPGEPPSDRTIERLKSMDTWSRYGREKAPAAMLLADATISAEDAARRKALIDQNWKHVVADNRHQLTKAHNLFKQHDMSRIHK